jgi:hypothetical protein
MEDSTKVVLVVTGAALLIGIGYLVAKVNSIELRLATQKQAVIVATPQPAAAASTETSPTSPAFLPNGVYYFA